MGRDPMTAEVLLTAQGISRHYGARIAVQDLNLELRRGEVLGLLGLNGAGKSTTLRVLTGVLTPHRGTVTIVGHDLARAPLAAKRHLGYLPEIPPLYPDARVDEFLSFCAALHAVPRAARAAAVSRSLERCGLTAVRARLIRNLSKGYQQRVGIAQAIVHEPPVLILDEPTIGLDPAQIQVVRDLIRAQREERAVLLSTHLLTEAETVCSRVVILHHGRLVYDRALDSIQQPLIVAFGAPPTASELLALTGIANVVPLATGRFECATDDPAAAAETIAAAALARRWRLLELSPGGTALERTFLNLTREHREAEAVLC
ncbi:MAG: ABC transporter ATP-binding protein [Gammaproteobacteria bacterium]